MILLTILLSVIGITSQSYTLSLDNDSLINPELYINQSYDDNRYISFKKGCYDLSEAKKPNKIKVGVFPSFDLINQYPKKKLAKHINSLFNEGNKMFMAQINIELVPIIYPPPNFVSINALGDLNSFVRTMMTAKKKEKALNIYISPSYSGIVGVAYIGTIGATNGLNSAVAKNTVVTIFHEIGHCIGAQHTFNSGGLLSYYNQLINGVLQMSVENKPQVCSALDYYFKNLKT